MREDEQQKSECEDDEQVQITDLDPEGSPLRRRARLARILLHKSIAMTWVRYSLVGLLLLLLLGTLLRELHPFPQTAASPTPVPPTPTAQHLNSHAASADDRMYIQSNDGTISAYQEDSGHVFWRAQVPARAGLSILAGMPGAPDILIVYAQQQTDPENFEVLNAENGKLLWRYPGN